MNVTELRQQLEDLERQGHGSLPVQFADLESYLGDPEVTRVQIDQPGIGPGSSVPLPLRVTLE
jgi:hypothetical protein